MQQGCIDVHSVLHQRAVVKGISIHRNRKNVYYGTFVGRHMRIAQRVQATNPTTHHSSQVDVVEYVIGIMSFSPISDAPRSYLWKTRKNPERVLAAAVNGELAAEALYTIASMSALVGFESICPTRVRPSLCPSRKTDHLPCSAITHLNRYAILLPPKKPCNGILSHISKS